MAVKTRALLVFAVRSKHFELELKRGVHNNLRVPSWRVPSPEDRLDAIGPPDPVSNLRPIVFAVPNNETALEKTYRETRVSTQAWNQEFWSKHNARFILERKKFQDTQKQAGVSTLTADEMSVFYKKFLDEHWQTHLNYNISWYKKNITLLFLEIRVNLARIGSTR
ncbi:COA8 family protein CG14806, mitochondrial [Athalia rosae]|uniref:COA8 family protein CG14806, mitochondrial n=1 Tax=Athalia rosae TaxID=37344 RepID=UPI0006258CAA|nr:COA8 family protein CG14806, mitochondrial [Athalia rosae]